MKQELYDDASALLELTVKISPQSRAALLDLSEAYVLRGDVERALHVVRAGRANSPRDEHLAFREIQLEFRLHRDTHEAESKAKALLKGLVSSSDLSSRVLLYRCYLFLSAIGEDQGELEKAVSFLQKAVAIPGVEDRAALLTMARLHSRSGDSEKALSAISPLLLKDSSDYLALNSLGLVLWRRGDLKSAREAFIRASAAKPDSATIRVHLAALLLEIRDYAGAIREYKAALELQPNNRSALAGLEAASRKETRSHSKSKGN